MTSDPSFKESSKDPKLETSSSLLLVLGLKEGGTFLASKFPKLMEFKNLCFLISLTPFFKFPYLLLRSRTSKCLTRDFASLNKEKFTGQNLWGI